MKTVAFIIALPDKDSQESVAKLIRSIKDTKSDIIPLIFPAVDYLNAERVMRDYNLEYTYPTAIPTFDTEHKLMLTPYQTSDIRKRIGCFLSHYIIWNMIWENFDVYKNAIILEQDAIFTEQYEKEYFDICAETEEEFICSLNSPIKATRKAVQFDKALKQTYEQANPETEEEYRHFEIPWIDEYNIPQGLPGNSAYVITPNAAKKLIDKTNEIGIWPNDALMCRQLFPNMLYAAYPYITKVQGNKSTTSL